MWLQLNNVAGIETKLKTKLRMNIFDYAKEAVTRRISISISKYIDCYNLSSEIPSLFLKISALSVTATRLRS